MLISVRQFVLLLALAAMAGCGKRGDPAKAPSSQPQTSATQGRKSRHAGSEKLEIERLIEALASPNETPEIGGTGKKIVLPAAYDPSAQKGVLSAADALIAKGTAAFPYLMKSFGDKRFSFVQDSPNGMKRVECVGWTCREIIECQVDVYEKLGVAPNGYPSYFRDVICGKDGTAEEESLAKWWNNHQNSSLCAIQLESIKWGIGSQKALLERQRFDDWNEKAFRETIARNEVLLRELQQSDSPIVPVRRFPNRER